MIPYFTNCNSTTSGKGATEEQGQGERKKSCSLGIRSRICVCTLKNLQKYKQTLGTLFNKKKNIALNEY